MKKPRFSDSQIIAILTQAEGVRLCQSYVGSKASVRQPFTSGLPNSGAWIIRCHCHAEERFPGRR